MANSRKKAPSVGRKKAMAQWIGVEFGTRLSMLREERSLSIGQLAVRYYETLGVTNAVPWKVASVVRSIEAGDRIPQLDTVLHLSKALGVSVPELLGPKLCDWPVAPKVIRGKAVPRAKTIARPLVGKELREWIAALAKSKADAEKRKRKD